MSKEKEHKTSNNRSIRQLLILKYGERCMFLKAHIPERLKRTTIKSYRRFKKEMHFTLEDIQTLESILTLHHLIHEAEGGETSEENGVVINELAHRYIHSLPKEHEDVINDMLREYKSSFNIRGGILTSTDSSVQISESFGLNMDILNDDFIEIPLVEEKDIELKKRIRHKKPEIKTRSNKKKLRGGGRFR